jgi:hypothetical protein
MKSEDSLSCSQEPAIDPYPELVVHAYTLFKNVFNIILPTPLSPKQSFPIWFSFQI